MMKPLLYFLQERGFACENCGSYHAEFNILERHHCIVKRSKNRPDFDEDINIELLCRSCHASGIMDSFEHRYEFAIRQINRGYDVKAWVESLNLKAPEAWLLEL